MNDENVKNGTFTLKNLRTREMFQDITVEEAVKSLQDTIDEMLENGDI